MSAEQKAKIAAKAMGRPSARRKPPVVVVCEHCGRTTEIPRRVARRPGGQRQRFCNTSCWYAHVRQHPEAHPWFRGGREPYDGPDWNEQARRARERDGHRCRDCGRHQLRPLLDVHHLAPRRAFDGDHVAANHLDNLITLCKSCHTRRENVA